MLLIDLSSVVVTSIVDLLVTDDKTELNENLVRHVAISQILNYKNKFKAFGAPILCADTKNYWRKDLFKFYKKNRKKDRSKSNIDWNKLFTLFDEIKAELKANFPYVLIEIPRVEADDIIAVLARETDEEVMIVSSDKDMLQLQLKAGARIQQFSPSVKKKINLRNKEYCLMTHIVKGDTSDGIPNIRSDDDVFMDEDKRQTRIYQKFIDSLKDADNPLDELDDVEKKKFKRNRLLVDVDHLPQRVVDWIHDGYAKELSREKKKRIYPYLKEKRMKLLLERIGEF
jgi:5'-3' exonuclease